MVSKDNTPGLMRLILLALLVSGYASADIVGIVTLDTSSLIGHAGAPFDLDFEMADFNFTPHPANTVTFSNFNFGGGSAVLLDDSLLGVTASTNPLGLTFTTPDSFGDAQLALTPGNTFSFEFDATSIPASDPQIFVFDIFDHFNGFTEMIRTTNPNGFDTFFELDLPTTTSGAQIIASGSNESDFDIAAPTVQLITTPEPATAGSLLAGVSLIVIRLWTRRRRAAVASLAH
jgi:hypothetical protein